MITKITRRKLRKLILKEVKLLRESSTSELLIEIEEAIIQIIASTGKNVADHDHVMRQLMTIFSSFVNYIGGPEAFEDFIYDHLHVFSELVFRTNKKGKRTITSFY